jgi:predicted RNase H-like HicB family nuclease
MAEAKAIIVYCHQEPDGWWAESPAAPGFTAAADSLDELEDQVRGGLQFLFGPDHPSAFLYIIGAGEAGPIGVRGRSGSPVDTTKPTSGTNTESSRLVPIA